jgi:catechol 2,3-dioxygenase-like lactoylglutathione lyase family enzyme
MEHVIAKLVGDFERGRLNRRQLIQSLVAATSAVGVASAAEGKVLKALSINHVSYQVADYAKTRDFYSGLFGMKVSEDDGAGCRLSFGDNVLIARTRPTNTPRVDHIAYTIANWSEEKQAMEAELKRRGLNLNINAKGDFHISDPDGFNVQIGGVLQ